MTQLCMPPEMLPTTLPQVRIALAHIPKRRLRNLTELEPKGYCVRYLFSKTSTCLSHRRDQGVLYWPGKCSVDHVKGFATIYAGKTLYQPGNGKGNGKWLPRNDALLAHLIGTTREVFDLADYGIRYVGTFKACQNVSELGTEEYRALSVEVLVISTQFIYILMIQLHKQIRTHIIGACASAGPNHGPKLSDIDRTKLADKYWAGEAKVQCLRWERSGFNMTLFHTLVALCELCINDAKEGQTSAKKRGKRGQASGGKKRKLDETGESISCKR